MKDRGRGMKENLSGAVVAAFLATNLFFALFKSRRQRSDGPFTGSIKRY
jgi:hypothetical protein